MLQCNFIGHFILRHTSRVYLNVHTRRDLGSSSPHMWCCQSNNSVVHQLLHLFHMLAVYDYKMSSI